MPTILVPRRYRLTAIGLAAALLMATPLRGQQPAAPADHTAHHPAPAAQAAQPAPPAAPGKMGTMMQGAKLESGRLDELVKKMNAATGDAKTAVMAEIITALVEHRNHCETMMAEKMKK